MWPAIMAVARRYAPMVVFPFAVIIGAIGYNMESIMSDRYTPWRESTIQRREKRKEIEEVQEFTVPKTIFDRTGKKE